MFLNQGAMQSVFTRLHFIEAEILSLSMTSVTMFSTLPDISGYLYEDSSVATGQGHSLYNIVFILLL